MSQKNANSFFLPRKYKTEGNYRNAVRIKTSSFEQSLLEPASLVLLSRPMTNNFLCSR